MSIRPILVVEDNPMDLDLMFQALQEHSVANPIAACRDGEEALQYIQAHRVADDPAVPILVLLDLRLPKVDGIDVLRQARSDAVWSQVPFVVMTTSRENTDIEAAYRLGRTLTAEGQHAAAVEWHLTAAYLAESSRWGRHALLEAGRSLTALQRTKEALVVYRKLMPKAFVRGANRAVLAAPPSIRVADPEDRVMQAEAAYGIAEILAGVGDQEAALDMYLTAAHLTAGTRAEDRALVGAIRSFVTMGDRASAELIYRRLQDSADRDPAVLAEARKNLGRRGNTAEQGGGSALPRGVLE